MDLKEKARRCREFLDALDEERRKVLVFHRELPLCLNLINQTIESYRRMIDVVATIDEEPVLKEFISLKPSSALEKEDQSTNNDQEIMENMKDWITNLCTHEPDSLHKSDRLLEKHPIAVETEESSDDLDHQDLDDVDVHNYSSKEKEIAASSNAEAISTTAGGSCGNGCCSEDAADHEENDKCRNPRKTRRCWSEDLHRKFLEAIDQLGGCHAATPRQIRELMKVEGLTNDEVKSHLQKFRLHWRRRSPVAQNHSTQFVVGIWIPPPDYAAATVGAAAATAEADNIPSSNVCSSQAKNSIFTNG